MIDRIGAVYHTSNIENGEYSYVTAAGSRARLQEELRHPFTHCELDIRFVFNDVVVLIETKPLFTESDYAQLKEYYDEEVAVNHSTKVICILANIRNDTIRVWKNGVDDSCLLPEELVLDNMSHYARLFETSIQNNRELVLKNTFDLNELLHKNDIAESLRSQFVGTTLLYIKDLVKRRGNPIIDDTFRDSLKSFWRDSGEAPIRAAISATLMDLLDGSENKQKKIDLLQKNVLQNQKVRDLDTESWVTILDTILGDIYRYINTDTSEGQDILNMFFIAFNKYTGKADKNQAFTPDHITEFMCRITDVDCTKVVLDGTCGSGSFLVQAMVKELADCSRGRTEEEANIQKDIVKKRHIYGIEVEEKAYGLSTTNMLIHGDGNSNIKLSSMFKCKTFIKEAKPDIILMNPPYNSKPKGIPDRYKTNWGKAKEGKEDPTKGLVFIQFLSDVLKEINQQREDNGLEKKHIKLAVLLPISAAIGSSAILTESKKYMLENNRLEAVFTLPYEIFYPGASVYACCMVFTLGLPHKNADGTTNKTFFGHFIDDGFKKKKNLGRIEQFDDRNSSKWKAIEERWLEAYRNKEVIEGFSAMAAVDEKDEWLCEEYMKTDFHMLRDKDFYKTVNGCMSYLMSQGEWRKVQSFISTLNSSSEGASDSIELNIDDWKPFDVTSLFKIERGTVASLNEVGSGDVPIVSASGENEGISFFGDVDEEYENNITFSMNGVNTGYTSYHSYKFNANADCGILVQKFEMNSYVGMFLSTVLGLLRSKYCYGRKMTIERMEKEYILLPVKYGEDGDIQIDESNTFSNMGYIPDWNYMENYIKSLRY